MLASLRIPAVLLGIGAGALAATLVALVVETAVQIATDGIEPGAGLVPGVMIGFFAGGFVAGRSAIIAHRFHGSVTGLALTGLVVFIARLGGSPAGIGPVLFLALLGMLIGGLGGTWAGRRNARASSTSHSG
jgi:hypothetical protein